MSKKQKKIKNSKKKFELLPNETIDQCIDRIKREGFVPVRRVEEPVFQEVKHDGQITYEPVGRKVVFDAFPVESER
ncbi:NETI motif-containing protein [Aquibacillus rhizosphaerae]|uniref:NETI motif-containing protein n=1 Tax=Aquibacillus rhizosphaerae TaxID=3051431 RepID=A0ABT7L832_9BACI|nr:NETI motif-containing protein [Aquibacillus sp. LR5S19]MDL4842011.1 NETI motif-containing protein [Aquibacillus sp. LR5S19]